MDVVAKANALAAAWPHGGPPITKNAVRLGLAQATFETHCGDDWPGSCNWGAAQYRACTAKEVQAIAAGTLRNGMWLYADGSWSAFHTAAALAVLKTDTHPGASGPVRYAVWFAAFPDDVDGAANYLHIVMRMASAVMGNPDATPEDLALAIYLRGYFEGSHAGARPVGQRSLPLTQPEAANVADYAAALRRVLKDIDPALAAWSPPTDDAGAAALARAALAQAALARDPLHPDDPDAPPDVG